MVVGVGMSVPWIVGRVSGRGVKLIRQRPGLWMILAVPIGLLLSLIPDLFMTIPWPIRKAGGWVTFIAFFCILCRRLLSFKNGDRWPSLEEKDRAKNEAWWERLLPWVLAGMVGSLAFPLLSRPDALPFGDWDHHLQKFEVIKRTVLEYKQFPWWTPWCRGGFPLASEPECGVVSVSTPLVLLLGPRVGLRLATVLCLMIAAEGTRRIARFWINDPLSSLLAGLIYGTHGGILVYTVAGHYLPMSYCAMPWMLYCTMRLAERPLSGIGLGFWTAFDLLNGITYPSIYAILITGLFWLRGLKVERERRVTFLLHTVLALGITLLLTGWRIATMAAVLHDYPRIRRSRIWLRPLAYVFLMIQRPTLEGMQGMTAPIFWESNCYIGYLGLGLFALSMSRPLRWWHWLALGCFALGVGGVAWYHPSYWLAHWPGFSTMHMVTRWRIPAMLGVGLALGGELAYWRVGRGRQARWLTLGFVLFLSVDLLLIGHSILPKALGPPPTEDRFPGESTDELINIENGPSFAATVRGFGVVRAHEPLLGYDRQAPTARLWRGHPDYVGEAWSDGVAIEPVYWSPNRIVFQLEPHQRIQINQNPGSWWWINGEQAFPALRCVEWEKLFYATANEEGRLELQIRPEGQEVGVRLHLLGALFIGGAWLGLSWHRSRSETTQRGIRNPSTSTNVLDQPI